MQDFLGWSGAFAGLVLGFGFLIFVHELGHFLVAKWVGVKVTQFAIGFGPGVLAWRRGLGVRKGSTEPEYEKRLAAGASPDSMGETEYRLNWLPLGGYVKMLGQEDMDPTATSDDPRSFNRRPIWARACVISAGVVMNLIFGLLLFVAAFMMGVKFPAPTIGGIAPGSPAAAAKLLTSSAVRAAPSLQPGDRIIQFDDQPVHDFLDVRMNTALADPGQPIVLTIQRAGVNQPLEFEIKPTQEPREKMLWLGVAPSTSLVVGQPEDPRAFPKDLAKAGVKPGMQVVAVEGTAIERYDQLEAAATKAGGQPIRVTFASGPAAADRREAVVSTLPSLCNERDSPNHLLGFVPAVAVKNVFPNSAASDAGLKAGDLIARIESVDWPQLEEVLATVRGSRGRPISIAVWRDGQALDLKPAKTRRESFLGPAMLGIEFGWAIDQCVVAETLPRMPGRQLNLTGGSRILAINGQEVQSYSQMQHLLRDLAQNSLAALPASSAATTKEEPSVALQMTFELAIAGNPRQTEPVTLDAASLRQLADTAWVPVELVGLLEPLQVTVVTSNPVDAVALGFHRTHMYMTQTYLTLARVFQGSVPASGMRGFVGISDIGTQIAYHQGLSWLLFFLGMISVNLVVINFLPIPIVDGGLMLFLIIEKIKGSPVGPKVLTAANVIGLVLIGGVFLFTLYHDLARLPIFK